MSRDRLAERRAQQGGGGGYNNQDAYQMQERDDYRSRARVNNPYAQQDDNSYSDPFVPSTANLVGGGAPGGGGGGGDDLSSLNNEIASIQDSIQQYNDNVSQIQKLHARLVDTTDDAAVERYNQQLQDLVDKNRTLSDRLRNRIKALQRQGGSGQIGMIRKQQTELVKTKFMDAIQNYQRIESESRQKYKNRVERQYKIVRPDATPEEVKAVVEDDQGGQVFSQALMTSNRYGDARSAYRDVQERHRDIKNIEKTLTELAQLFNDMSILVEQQDEQITHINDTVKEVETDVEVGLNYTSKAVDSARSARKKRWICFVLCLVIIIIIAVVVVVVIKGQTK
ncbi:t-SNARE [Polyporus arcularius HHB13444]|uniref:t-SNARE n=2 Tax=Polyporaceae TaxID=5317 RepID=A0A5C3PDA7_9APHY|nr:t-SNARE [Polyporus brumalis]TFK86919.1 t-SNARE [Polyporus arcularius HHB13444]